MILARIIEAVLAASRAGKLARQERVARITGLQWLLSSILLGCCAQVCAQSGAEDFLSAVAGALLAGNVEALPNLNDREAFSLGPQAPRLGGFPDLPPGAYPGSGEIEAWEAAWRAREIGGLALRSAAAAIASEAAAAAANDVMAEHFLAAWLGELESERLFVSFAVEDEKTAMLVARVAGRHGYEALPLRPGEVAGAGEFYATARHRLAIDSRAARRLRTDVTEMELLGERLRRNSDSVFRDPPNRDDRGLSRREPEIFRKITLGDEFNQPTIEEIIVPGGIAFGESAALDFAPAELIFDGDFFLLRGFDPETGEDTRRHLPRDDRRLLKTLFDLARRSIGIRSDAVVDLDADRRVRISSALRDTDAGYAMLFADTLPFEHLDYLPVSKSVIIDTGVSWRRSGFGAGSPQEFATDFEVRFLSADSMRIARTRLALAYEYDSASGAVRYAGNWGRYSARLRASTDVDGLGAGLAELARHAGWVALFRRLERDSVPFLKGRYQFMKIDKAGRETPRRFR